MRDSPSSTKSILSFCFSFFLCKLLSGGAINLAQRFRNRANWVSCILSAGKFLRPAQKTTRMAFKWIKTYAIFNSSAEQMLTENSLCSTIRKVISIPFGVARHFFHKKKNPAIKAGFQVMLCTYAILCTSNGLVDIKHSILMIFFVIFPNRRQQLLRQIQHNKRCGE